MSHVYVLVIRSCHLCSMQLIFVDQIHRKLYVTRDEGETYSTYEVKFDVDDITFQPKTAEHSVDPPYNEYILAYDETNQSVSIISI